LAVEEFNSGLPRTNRDSSRVEDLNQGPPKPLGKLPSQGGVATSTTKTEMTTGTREQRQKKLYKTIETARNNGHENMKCYLTEYNRRT